MYAKRPNIRIDSAQMAEKCIQEWEKNRLSAIKMKKDVARVNNCICFSRKIGVGALEIADIVAEKTGLHVIDREIIEYIAYDTDLRQTTVDSFDERYPGVMENIGAMFFGEKSFTMDEYLQHLISTVYSVADDSPAIFVGRGAHLILPREKVLAVRCISSKSQRAQRIAGIMKVSESEALKKLAVEDKLQADFFKKNFGKKSASPYEFDLVINRDYLTKAEWAADLVVQAYKLKFGSW
jgi:cytidylate kinase